MQQLDDYPIGPERSSPAPPAPPRKDRWRAWLVLGFCMAVTAVLAAFFLMRPSSDRGATASASKVEGADQKAPPATGPLGPTVEPRELPPLDLSDPLVRELLSGLSSRPELAAWLATDGLIRNVVASVDAVANGTTPSTQLRRLAPGRPFSVEARGEDFVIDARSYERYDGIADTVASLDADGLARAYSTLRPRLQEAYRELGYPDGNFDDAVQRAIARLLNTPMPEREVSVQPAPVLYQFTDQRLERLTPAQKQLLRMGPRNVRLIQAKLRDIAHALGIPAERLRS
jgi:hypothetical protein